MSKVINVSGLVSPQQIEKILREDAPNQAEFRIQPLERGYGHTLGNAMRRMLLSSLPGAAVWAFRIDNVLHEHQTIPGVAEDVHQIIGNLKTLVIALDDSVNGVVLRISKRQAGAVTAADIESASGMEVVDPSHHILTITEDRELNIELHVNRGRGYVEADSHPVEKGSPVDLVRIDSIYNPVRRANFSVSETRVGQRTDYDRLTLLVETDGTITPEEAVSYAAALAQTHFQFFVDFGTHTAGSGQQGVELPEDEARNMIDLLGSGMDHFKAASEKDEGLSVRTMNAMKNLGVRFLGDLVKFTWAEIKVAKGMGSKSLREIIDLLERKGLKFGMRFTIEGNRIWVYDWGTAAPLGDAALEAEEEVPDNAAS